MHMLVGNELNYNLETAGGRIVVDGIDIPKI